jgi:hypothetical protein
MRKATIGVDMAGEGQDETVVEMSRYVKTFLDRRFPEGLNDQMLLILTDIVLDVFRDGAAWAETQIEKDTLRNKLLDNAAISHFS